MASASIWKAWSLAIRRQQVFHQSGEILESLAERGDIDPQDVEPVVEVLPERALGDLVEEVAFGRGDDPHVGGDGRAAAHSFEDFLFDGSEQLRLLLQRDVVDVVEVERTSFGQIEASRPLLLGPGKRSFLVTVQFALDEIRRKKRAADLDEGKALAVRVAVDDRGDQVLARRSRRTGARWRRSENRSRPSV